MAATSYRSSHQVFGVFLPSPAPQQVQRARHTVQNMSNIKRYTCFACSKTYSFPRPPAGDSDQLVVVVAKRVTQFYLVLSRGGAAPALLQKLQKCSTLAACTRQLSAQPSLSQSPLVPPGLGHLSSFYGHGSQSRYERKTLQDKNRRTFGGGTLAGQSWKKITKKN